MPNVKKLSRVTLCAIVTLCLLILSAPVVMAQSATTGALSGTVTDSSGAVVPNAMVTVTGEAGTARTTTTAADGSYRVALLPPGNYRVKFEATGFSTEEVAAVVVNVTETHVLNRTLTVGSQNQQVTVQASVENVQTANSTLGTVITNKAVVDLPLSTRNFTNLLALSSGANASVNNGTALGQGGVSIAVNGASTAQNNYQQDGVNVSMYAGSNTLTNGGNTALPPIPNPDTIQEFKVQTSNYDASYGRNSGANVNVVTRSGTNEFHGTAFEFFRNTLLNANDWFLNHSGKQRGVFNQNQYGGVLGGPVKKDKLFFFVSYQATGQKNGFSSNSLSTGLVLPPVPTGNRGTCTTPALSIAQIATNCDAATQTFVSNLGNAMCYANHMGTTPSQYRPFRNTYDAAGNPLVGVNINCNGNNINPQAVQILQLKLPNGQYYIPSSGTGAFSSPQAISSPALYNEKQGNGNWDYIIDSKNTVSGKYFILSNPAALPFPGANYLPGTPESTEFGNQIGSVKLTTLLSSNLVNEARVSYYRNTTTISMPLLSNFNNSQLGITGVNPGGPFDFMPGIIITGLFTSGYQYQQFQSVAENTPSVSDQISWTRGKHTVRAGFDWTHTHYKWFQPSYQIGLMTADTFADFLLGLPGCVGSTAGAACTGPAAVAQAGGAGVVPQGYNFPGGNAGNGTNFSNIDNIGAFTDRSDPAGLLHYFTSSNSGAFLQDDFKLNSKLTLNFGLRWEYDEFTSDQNGDGTNIWTQLIKVQPIPGAGCVLNGHTYGTPGAAGNVNGCSFAGYVAPSNYQPARRGPLPAGVFQNDRTDPTKNGPPKDNFAPRLGFAWQPITNRNLVIRGGFGYFYDYIPGGNLAPPINQQPPYLLAINNSGTTNFQSSLAQPFVPTPLGWVPRYLNFTNGVGSNFNPAGTQGPIQANLTTPLTYQYNLQAQYEFLPNWVVELGYVGTHGIHQEVPDPVNAALLASPTNPLSCGYDGVATDCITGNASSGGVVAGVGGPAVRVPYLGFQPSFHMATSSGGYKFNSFQATVRKTFSHGLLFQAAYTYSNALVTTYWGNPNASLTDNVPLIPVYEANPSYRPQRLVINYSWNLPFGHHEGIMDKLLNGWTVSGVTVIQSGTPLTVTDTRVGTIFGSPSASTTANGGGTTLTAEYAPGMGVANVRNPGSPQSQIGPVGTTPLPYLNPAAFCNPTLTTCPISLPTGVRANGIGYGNSGLGTTRGPNQNNWDISIVKVTKVGGINENATLQFRTEFFNAFNHPQFNNPNGATTGQVAYSASNFGLITSSLVNARLIQFALKYQF